MVEQPTEEQVKEKVRIAIDLLNRSDTLLFETDVNEPSIAHKFATYLEDEFQDGMLTVNTIATLKNRNGSNYQKKPLWMSSQIKHEQQEFFLI